MTEQALSARCSNRKQNSVVVAAQVGDGGVNARDYIQTIEHSYSIQWIVFASRWALAARTAVAEIIHLPKACKDFRVMEQLVCVPEKVNQYGVLRKLWKEIRTPVPKLKEWKRDAYFKLSEGSAESLHATIQEGLKGQPEDALTFFVQVDLSTEGPIEKEILDTWLEYTQVQGFMCQGYPWKVSGLQVRYVYQLLVDNKEFQCQTFWALQPIGLVDLALEVG